MTESGEVWQKGRHDLQKDTFKVQGLRVSGFRNWQDLGFRVWNFRKELYLRVVIFRAAWVARFWNLESLTELD